MSDPSGFAALFGVPPAATVEVPGRVNLIGEHIDYTGGTVLPTPIPATITVEYRPGDGPVRVHAAGFGDTVTREASAPNTDHWSDYVMAGHRMAMSKGLAPPGGFYGIESRIPHGAGVSSSAALLVAILRAAAAASGTSVGAVDIALWAQAAEREDIGVPCGIMDQMAVSVGRMGCALALDTATLTMRHIPLPEAVAFPVFHSGLTRALADGAYRERREATETAARALGLEHLSLADDEALARAEALPDPVCRRARHAITEHRRVLAATAALEAGDAERFGELMTMSHRSMRDDFEIVPPAMDDMVASACRLGAFGARLTGGGFGGCFVACVPAPTTATWVTQMQDAHPGIALITDGRIRA